MISMISSHAIGSSSCALPGSPRFTTSPIPLLRPLALWAAEMSQRDAKQKTNHLPMHQKFFCCAVSAQWMQQRNIVAYFTDRNCINIFLLFFAETIVFSLLTSLRQKMFFSPFMFFDALLAGVKFATCFLLKFCWNDCFFPFWPCCVWFCFQPRTKSHPQVKSWTTRFPPNCR